MIVTGCDAGRESMKSFDIITEADARVLEIGSSVILTPGGHVTPLAADTLKARRIAVLSGVAEASLDGLAPVADIRSIAIGSDHSGVALKARLRDHLRQRGLSVLDVGTEGTDPVDYPDIAAQVARLVARKEVDAAIVIDGAGLGSAIAANKIDGARAAMCTDKTLARYSREHNGANVLALGATLISVDEAKAIVETWIATPMREARYIRRLAKIRALERMP
jgi:ribose 5-phosphate isomerase B